MVQVRHEIAYDCDVLVIGGGIVGVSTAYAITRAAPGSGGAGLGGEAGPAARSAAFVRGQAELAGDRRHRAVVAISASELDAGAREKIRAAHGGLVAMIVEALGEMGHAEPRLAAMLLQGVVDAAVRRIELGAAEEPAAITEAAVAMALRGVRGESAARAC